MKSFLSAVVMSAIVCSSARAITVEFRSETRPVTPEEVNDEDGPPADAYVVDFFLTSDQSVFKVADVFVLPEAGQAESLYQHPNGLNGPPTQAFVNEFPAMAAHSWVRVPGGGASIGELGEGSFTAFTEADGGPQSDFHFARITSSPSSRYTFSGFIEGPPTPQSVNRVFFSLDVCEACPEPSSSLLCAIGMFGLMGMRCR